MEEVTAKIGENAGVVWAALSGVGLQSVAQIIRTTQLNRRDVDLAIGWLAREDKLDFERDTKQRIIRIGLKEKK